MALLETPELDSQFIAVDFHLLSTDGHKYSLKDLKKMNGLVVAFICNHCPYVQAIADKIARDALALEEIGIGFVAINANDSITYPDDSYENMKVFAKQHNFSFPYLLDDTQETAKHYGAVCTPDFFGFDKDLYLQYRGRLDSAGKTSLPNAEKELLNAMKVVSKGDKRIIKQYPSIGCSIKWKI